MFMAISFNKTYLPHGNVNLSTPLHLSILVAGNNDICAMLFTKNFKAIELS